MIGGFNYISDTHLAAQDYWSGTLGASWLLVDSHRSSRKAESLRLKEGQALKQRNEAASKIALAVRSNWLSLQSSRSALQVAKAGDRPGRREPPRDEGTLPRAGRHQHRGPRRRDPPAPDLHRLLQLVLRRPPGPVPAPPRGGDALRAAGSCRQRLHYPMKLAMIAAQWDDRTMRDCGWLTDYRCGLATGPRQSAEGGCGQNCLVLR